MRSEVRSARSEVSMAPNPSGKPLVWFRRVASVTWGSRSAGGWDALGRGATACAWQTPSVPRAADEKRLAATIGSPSLQKTVDHSPHHKTPGMALDQGLKVHFMVQNQGKELCFVAQNQGLIVSQMVQDQGCRLRQLISTSSQHRECPDMLLES